ncbi:MAG: hypothetical protein F6J95_012885 [Leptolyngbya sp. SIO1E4]|nr:hypothetical protein [Leptolyngbya sp. SIO1E4]
MAKSLRLNFLYRTGFTAVLMCNAPKLKPYPVPIQQTPLVLIGVEIQYPTEPVKPIGV